MTLITVFSQNTASKTYIPHDIQHSGIHWSYHHIDRGSQLCGEGEGYAMEEVRGERRKEDAERRGEGRTEKRGGIGGGEGHLSHKGANQCPEGGGDNEGEERSLSLVGEVLL